MAKEEHPTAAWDRALRSTSGFPWEEDPPDKADGAGVQGHPERDTIPKLNMEDQHGGQGSPTPQAPLTAALTQANTRGSPHGAGWGPTPTGGLTCPGTQRTQGLLGSK